MDTNLKKMLGELDVNKTVEHIEWLTKNTPSRISGTGDDRLAAEYIVGKMKEYGLDEAQILEYETYNSRPGTSQLKILSPETTVIDSLPCAHIASTLPQGNNYEVVYLGSGGEEDYIGKDVKGKAVLVEVSYAPATPEKAMIASKKGVAAMICMNWGQDQPVICWRGLKAVWGNPTPTTYPEIPQIAGVSITRKAGEYLRDLCLKGPVTVNLMAQSSRVWEKLPQPFGVLRGSEEPEKFLLVSGHLDAWDPGVTCNATGDGTMLELIRVLAKNKDLLKRSIYFGFWNGHEIAEASGSTWFADYFWGDMAENCIGYINVDSTGMLNAQLYRANTSRELFDFSSETLDEIIGTKPAGLKPDVAPLGKIGDQSFFGLGVPSFAGRIGYTAEQMAADHGATLGWWNHTYEDSLDKMSVENLALDDQINLAIIYGLVNAPVLPYDFTRTVEDVETKLDMILRESKGVIDITYLPDMMKRLKGNVEKLNAARKEAEAGKMADEKRRKLDSVLLNLSRTLTATFYTYADRYSQDSYGLTILSKPIPLLYRLIELADMDKESLDYKLLYTQLLRNRNRVSDAIKQANDYIELFLAMK